MKIQFLLLSFLLTFVSVSHAFAYTVDIEGAKIKKRITITAPLRVTGLPACSNKSYRINLQTGISIRGGRFISPPFLDTDCKILRLGSDSGVTINGEKYDGSVSLRLTGKNSAIVVNRIDIEKYLEGVVASEMGGDWPIEALKAQAIASRTYAVYKNEKSKNGRYLFSPTTKDQAYNRSRQVSEAIKNAVRGSSSEIVMYEGKPALTLFHSTAGGRTADVKNVFGGANYPYLKSVSARFENDSSLLHWQRKIETKTIGDSLRRNGFKIGRINHVRPTALGPGGRIKTLFVFHSGGKTQMTGEQFRKAIGYNRLPSTRFTLYKSGKYFKFRGRGYGHGVGMSQFSAKGLAEHRWSHQKILAHFYRGTTIGRIEDLAGSAR